MPEEANDHTAPDSSVSDGAEPSVSNPTEQPVSEPTVNTPVPLSGGSVAPGLPPARKLALFRNSKRFGLFAAIAIGLFVLIGASAAAYYGVVVPNKPENTLKKAVSNTITQKKIKFDGKLSYESTDNKAAIKAVNATFNGAADTEANTFGSAIEIIASGAKLPIELRRVDKSLYFKIGDLSSVKGLVQTAAPELASTIDVINKKVANQWVEVDETLLKQTDAQTHADCTLNTSFALTQADVELLQKRYQEVPFAAVKSTSADTVNGHSATKYEVEINDNKGAEFAKGLQDLSVVKKLKACDSSKSKSSPDTTSLADNDITPLTIWVSKDSKQIVKLAGKSTAQDEQKSKFKASFEVTMQYGQATIIKPEGAKPALDLLSSLAPLLGSSAMPAFQDDAVTPSSLHGPSDVSGVSPECLQAIQAYANSNGSKPIPANCL